MACVAVIGVGAIGGVCAASLIAAGHEVTCCVRTPFRELVLDHDGRSQTFPVRVETDPSQLPPVEWALLATKAHQTEGAAGWLARAARVAVLQNGVEHVSRVSRWIDAARVVPVVVSCPASAVAPGHIAQRSSARFTVPDDHRGHAFAALLAGTPIAVDLSADWPTAAWRKLCFNVTGGALAALAGVPLPAIQHPQLRALALALAHECALVARAEGADVPAAFADATAAQTLATTSGGSPSTLTDRLHGRPLEVDARNGAVVRLAARHGIPVPANTAATALLAHAHETPGDLLPLLATRLGH